MVCCCFVEGRSGSRVIACVEVGINVPFDVVDRVPVVIILDEWFVSNDGLDNGHG